MKCHNLQEFNVQVNFWLDKDHLDGDKDANFSILEKWDKKTYEILDKDAFKKNLNELVTLCPNITHLLRGGTAIGRFSTQQDYQEFREMQRNWHGAAPPRGPRSASLHEVTDKNGEELSRLTKLETLDLSGCEGITDGIGPDLRKLTKLETLDLSKCNITNEIADHLGELPNLKTLFLLDCPNITDEINTRLEHLENLNIIRDVE